MRRTLREALSAVRGIILNINAERTTQYMARWAKTLSERRVDANLSIAAILIGVALSIAC